ncbi:LysR family transcriptional regulator, partial [Sulfurovum sp. bin170]|uniref:LysR substrate-binding domain-containing protein n=1 Tax=Sulfurovum sp. bin170 TaxID=2695268 RepID=UPI0014185832
MSNQIEDKFRVGASHTIGSYILPGEIIDSIHQQVNRQIKLIVAPCDEVVKAIKEQKLDLGFIESPVFDDSLVYREWMEDELVVCSKKQLPSSLSEEDLNRCRIVGRERGSLSRAFIENFLEKQGLSYYDFDSISEVDSPIAIIQSIKWSKPHAPITAVAIVSKLAIEYELKYNDLYESSINNTPIIRKFYILYREDS